MKTLLALIILLTAAQQASAGGSDYQPFTDVPVTVCAEDYGDTWNRYIVEAIAKMNEVVPSEYLQTDYSSTCNVVIRVVDILPASCYGVSGRAHGCTFYSTRTLHSIYVWRGTTWQAFALLHELIHAYGIVDHFTTPDCVITQSSGATQMCQAEAELLRSFYDE